MAQVQCGDDNGGFLSTKRLLLFHGQLRNEIVCKEMQLRLLGGGGGGRSGEEGLESHSHEAFVPLIRFASVLSWLWGCASLTLSAPGTSSAGSMLRYIRCSNNSEK